MTGTERWLAATWPVVRDALPARPARVVELGCGTLGGHVPVLRAAGYEATAELRPVVGGPDPAARGRELVEVLDLAARFPARHEPTLRFPRFADRVSMPGPA